MRKSRRQRAHPGGTSARNQLVHSPARGIARDAAPDLSRQARVRLEMLDWHRAHGGNVARTARHFGYSRPTVYRWLARFDRDRLETLEDASSAPHRRRRPSWTVGQVAAVRAVRDRYPRWGKAKLAILLRRDGIVLSVSMIGRILVRLRHTGELREPVYAIRRRMRAWRRPYAIRKPAGWAVERPGDLVQLDTVEIRPTDGRILKQFTARDVVSRWDTLEVRGSATARSAAAILDALAERMPFPVRAISVDGGSEFMAEFEEGCRDRHIALFVLPPRSPKLHGSVERANRTHTEEFYEVTDADFHPEAIRAELLAWERTYNTIRPHQALGYLTPAEFLASVGVDV